MALALAFMLSAPASAANPSYGLTSSRYFVSATVDADATWNLSSTDTCGGQESGSESIVTTPPAHGVTIVKTVWEFRSYVKGIDPQTKKPQRVWKVTQVRPAAVQLSGSSWKLPSVTTTVDVHQDLVTNDPCVPAEEQVPHCSAAKQGPLVLEMIEGTLADVAAGSGERGSSISLNGQPEFKVRAYGSDIDNACGSRAECPYMTAGCSTNGTSDAEVAPLVGQLPWSTKILRKFSRQAVASGKADFTVTVPYTYGYDVMGMGRVNGHYNVTFTFDRMS